MPINKNKKRNEVSKIAVNIEQIIELKKILSDKFEIYLHMHNACGVQSFSFENPADIEIQTCVSKYFAKLGYTVQVSDSADSFIVR